jgi:hypothetical protein
MKLKYKSDIYLSNAAFERGLRRLRDLITQGEALVAEDSNDIGNKYTRCSWGACSSDERVWADPDQKLIFGPTRYRESHQKCPMDVARDDPDTSSSGCFYRCRVFQSRHKTPTREEALALYAQVLDTSEDAQ